MPWLHKWNPKINWISNTVSIPKSPVSPPPDYIPQWYLLWWLGLDVNQKISNRLSKWQAWLDREQINKTTISTQIAQTTPLTEPVIPGWCSEFADVFSKKTHDQLPFHCPYDHTIELKPDFIPKIAKVYSLNPTEMETCKTFVKEHLKTGQIVPSKSLQASPFFFIPKKDEHCIHAKTTITWTPIPSTTPILFPSSQNSLRIWRSPHCLLNLTFNGDTTTSAFRKRINGKLLSLPQWDSSNPLLYSSDSVMLPPHSKHL